MISNSISFAPAWVPGTGSVVARPHACATALPSLAGVFAEVQGTGVPMAGTKRRVVDFPGTGLSAAALPITEQHDPITQHDGTTPLGIHSPGRPKS
jgi:hypothetical protein